MPATEYIWNPLSTFLNEPDGVDSTATSFAVTDASLWSGTLPTRIQVEDEIMMLTAIAANVFTVTRALEGTSAAAHSAGLPVVNVVSSGALYAVFVAI